MKKLNYKWVIVALCFLMTFTTLGFCSSTKSLFIGPITEHLEIDRGIFSINDSLRFIVTAVVNVFFGALVMKLGERKMIATGFLSLISGVLCYSFAENVWLLYLGGILLGIGFSLTGTTIVGVVVTKWVKENKGTIMGAILASNGLGGALAMQIVNPLIDGSFSIPGYKIAYIVIACVLAVVGTLITLLFKNEPPHADRVEQVTHTKKKRGQSWEGISFDEAKRKSFFYGTLVCIFFTGAILQAINGVAVQHMKDTGIDSSLVATIWSVHSLCLAGFKFLTGFIYDRAGLRKTVNLCTVVSVIVMFILGSVTNSTIGIIFAIIYSIFSGMALPLETIMLPIYAGDLFGDKSYAKILGLIVSFNTAGYAVGAPLMNLSYDIFGSYKYGLYFCGFLMIGVIVALQFVITAGNKTRAEVEERKLVKE